MFFNKVLFFVQLFVQSFFCCCLIFSASHFRLGGQSITLMKLIGWETRGCLFESCVHIVATNVNRVRFATLKGFPERTIEAMPIGQRSTSSNGDPPSFNQFSTSPLPSLGMLWDSSRCFTVTAIIHSDDIPIPVPLTWPMVKEAAVPSDTRCGDADELPWLTPVHTLLKILHFKVTDAPEARQNLTGISTRPSSAAETLRETLRDSRRTPSVDAAPLAADDVARFRHNFPSPEPHSLSHPASFPTLMTNQLTRFQVTSTAIGKIISEMAGTIGWLFPKKRQQQQQ